MCATLEKYPLSVFLCSLLFLSLAKTLVESPAPLPLALSAALPTRGVLLIATLVVVKWIPPAVGLVRPSIHAVRRDAQFHLQYIKYANKYQSS